MNMILNKPQAVIAAKAMQKPAPGSVRFNTNEACVRMHADGRVEVCGHTEHYPSLAEFKEAYGLTPTSSGKRLFEQIAPALREFGDEERDAFFRNIFDNYCRHCGGSDPNCNCWNDE